jgi:hypothetical protein
MNIQVPKKARNLTIRVLRQPAVMFQVQVFWIVTPYSVAIASIHSQSVILILTSDIQLILQLMVIFNKS